MDDGRLPGEMTLDGIAKRLDAIDAKLGGLETNVGGLDARLVGIETKVGGLDARLGGLDARLGGLDTKVGGLDARLGGLDARLGGLDTNVGGLDATLGGLDTKVGGLQAEMRSGFKRVDEKLNEAKIRDEELHGLLKFSLEAREGLRESMEQRFDVMGNKHDQEIDLLKDVLRHVTGTRASG
jgi:chromosome segregation ATPase